MNPFLGGNSEVMDPLEWLARMSDHIPDPGQHRTLFYGAYANRVRGGAARSPASRPPPAQSSRRCPRLSPPSWGAHDRQGLPGGSAACALAVASA